MTVGVRLGGRLGAGHQRIALPEGATVQALLAAIAGPLGLDPRGLEAAAVALDGEVVGRRHPLRDGDEIAVILPVAGG